MIFAVDRAGLVHVHRLAEIADNPFRAQPARFDLVGIPAFAVQQLLVANRHASSANPVVAIS